MSAVDIDVVQSKDGLGRDRWSINLTIRGKGHVFTFKSLDLPYFDRSGAANRANLLRKSMGIDIAAISVDGRPVKHRHGRTRC